jgi:AsmA protein
MRGMRKALVALVVFLALAVGLVYWLLSDPNRFKSELTERIRTETGLLVDIGGDLSWRLWPPVQLVAHDIVADWTAAPERPLVRIAALTLDVDLWAILGADARLVVDGMTLSGLDAHLVQRGETANWSRPGSREAPSAPLPVAVPTGWEVSTVSIRDSTLHYDLDGETYDVAIDDMRLADLAPGRTSPLRAKLTLTTAAGAYDLDARAEVTTAADAARIEIRGAEVSGVARAQALPFRATFAAAYDLGTGIVTLNDANVELAGVKAKLDVEGRLLEEVPVWRGRIDLPRQSVAKLAALADVTLDEPLALKARYTASAERVELEDLDLGYGDTTVKGKAGVRLGERTSVTFDLTANALTIPAREAPKVALGAGGFGAVAFAAPAATADPGLDAPILPLEQVRSIDWDGALLIERLVHDKVTFPNARVRTRNRKGRLDGTLDLPQFFGGTAHAAWNIDARKTPVWTVKPKLENVDSTALLAWLDQKYTWAALLLGNADLTMTGNTPRELATTLKGNTQLDGGQGRLDIAAIKQQALAIAAIAGGVDKVNAWPDILSYKRLTSTWKVDGFRHDLKVLLDNLSITLDGTVDPFSEAMDVVASVKLLQGTPYQSFVLDPTLMNVDLPVRCKGTVSTPDCKPDPAGMRTLLTRVLTSDSPEVKARVDKTIEEKVPEQYRDTARSLLDMLRQGGSPGTQQPPAPPESPAPSSAPSPAP